MRLTHSPIVQLNHAVAIAETGDPAQALVLADRLQPALSTYTYLHSTRAELLRRLGRSEEARRAYERALELASREPDRRFIKKRLAEL